VTSRWPPRVARLVLASLVLSATVTVAQSRLLTGRDPVGLALVAGGGPSWPASG